MKVHLNNSQTEANERVLIVVFLRGGADGLTLVPPVGDDEYHRQRPTIRIKPEDAIPLDGYFGLNTSLRPLMRLLDDGRMRIVQGAGSEDSTKSHFEAQDLMEHGGSATGGWIGRFMRARSGTGSRSALSTVAIGAVQPESMRGAPSCAVMENLSEFSLHAKSDQFTEHLRQLYANGGGALAQAGIDTLSAAVRLRDFACGDPGLPRHIRITPSVAV